VVEADADDSLQPTEDASLELTEAEVDSDRLLALRTAWASLTGYAAWIHPAMGAAATALTPVFEKIATFAVKKLGERRIEHAAETLLDAADAADQPVADFIEKAVADDRRHELFARTLRIAQDTALREKRRALGRALAAGVMGDDARIDEELLFIRAVEDIDEIHIRLLGRLADGSQSTAGDIARADPGLQNGLLALLGQMQSHGLIDSRSPVTPGGAMTPEPRYFITDWGRAFLARLAEDPDRGR
jgi:hypothetical protein